jgi:hypothetical protein
MNPRVYRYLLVLFLAFAPLVFFLPRRSGGWREGPLIRVGAAALAGLVVWVAVCPSLLAPRYILCTLLLLALPVARGAEYVSLAEPRPRWVGWGALLLTALLVGGTLRSKELRRLASVTGKYCTTGYALPEDDLVTGILAVNREAAPGDRVFLATSGRFWLRPDLLQCLNGTGDGPVGGTPGELWASLFDRGFRYLIVDLRTHPQFSESLGVDGARPPPAPEWLHVESRPVGTPRGEHSFVFRLTSREPGRRPAWTTRQMDASRWEVVRR